MLPGTSISGGIYVIFEHAHRINLIFGNRVFILTEKAILPDEYAWHPHAKTLSWMTYEDAYCTKFDIVIATFWKTVYDLHRFESRQYAYFVQSIESKFYPDEEHRIREWVDSTYCLRLHTITEATWIKEYLEEKYLGNTYLVKNGIRKDLYKPHGVYIKSREKNKLRVLVEGPLDVPFKNVRKALELCKKSLTDEVWLLTASSNVSNDLADKVFSQIPIEDVPAIYRSCDVIVKLSYVEGMFGPPLEIFHCGGTAIVYKVTGYNEYMIDGFNSIVVAKDDECGVINAINKLKNDSDYLTQLKNNALSTAKEWIDWDVASRQFYSALNDIMNQDKYDRDTLRILTIQIDNWLAISGSSVLGKNNIFRRLVGAFLRVFRFR